MTTLSEWTNSKAKVAYKRNKKTVEPEQFKIFICVTILIGDYRSMSENKIQLLSKHDGRPTINHMNCRKYEQLRVLRFDNAKNNYEEDFQINFKQSKKF